MFSLLSAFGKAILLGEHAVVYNRPALAVGLPNGLTVGTMEPTDGRLELHVPAWNLQESDSSASKIGQALRKLKTLVAGSGKGFDLEISANLPLGAGLGSSAALAVVATKALLTVRGAPLESGEIRRLAFELEKVFHGQPSGLDDTVASFGGLCLFRRNGWIASSDEHLSRFEPVTEQALALPFPVPSLVIGHSGVPRETLAMVDGVRRRHENDPAGTTFLFDAIERCVMLGLDALKRRDLNALGAAMNENQQLLTALGVSAPEIDMMVDLARQAGSPGAKLTGAGGGGCVIALAGENGDAILKAWSRAGFEAWLFQKTED
ncbi:MAG: mevalonate kinase [Myxococcales bacterium]|nr:MAG: mevalonate kinase [Myxococcales bacterium]